MNDRDPNFADCCQLIQTDRDCGDELKKKSKHIIFIQNYVKLHNNRVQQ